MLFAHLSLFLSTDYLIQHTSHFHMTFISFSYFYIVAFEKAVHPVDTHICQYPSLTPVS